MVLQLQFVVEVKEKKTNNKNAFPFIYLFIYLFIGDCKSGFVIYSHFQFQ